MTEYLLATGERVRVAAIENIPPTPTCPAQGLYTLLMLSGRCVGQEMRLTEREMVLNQARKIQ